MSATVWPIKPPWPHQAEAFAACLEYVGSAVPPVRGLVQMPTGTGKSRLMRALTYHFIARRRRVIVALPSEEILAQLGDDFRRESRQPVYVDKAERTGSAAGLITLASHQTLWRRLKNYAPDSVLLFDECQHSGRPARCNLRSLSRFGLVLGFSAAPWSEDCAAVYGGRVLYTYGLRDATAAGYLAPLQILPFPEAVPAPVAHELYFCASNGQAQQLAASCAGAAYIGHESKDRAALVQRFRAGQIRRLYLNRCLTEGFDCPAVARIFVDKVSESDLLNYQMVGRGLRCKADAGELLVYCRDIPSVTRALERAG